VFNNACLWAEDKFDLKLVIDSDVVQEIKVMAEETLKSYSPVTTQYSHPL